MKRIIFFLAIIAVSFTNSLAQQHWSFELQGAEVYNVPLPLTIRQNAYPDIKLTAHYRTEPFILPYYYDGRLSRWTDGKSWELEMIHHKIYLKNTTSEVPKFSVSHGFNMIFVNRGIQVKSFRYHAGAGLVIAHPESIVRDKDFAQSTDETNWGYFLSGMAVNLAVNRPFYLGSRFYLNAEAKTTLGYASVRIAQGHADVYNIAFHILLGLGIDSRE